VAEVLRVRQQVVLPVRQQVRQQGVEVLLLVRQQVGVEAALLLLAVEAVQQPEKPREKAVRGH